LSGTYLSLLVVFLAFIFVLFGFAVIERGHFRLLG
jgi:hypothetical protein